LNGRKGLMGSPGKDGKNGNPGEPGIDGKDGKSVNEDRLRDLVDSIVNKVITERIPTIVQQIRNDILDRIPKPVSEIAKTNQFI